MSENANNRTEVGNESINQDIVEQLNLNKFKEVLGTIRDSGDISQQEKENFLKLWLGDDQSKINENNNGLIDKFILESINLLRNSNHDNEAIINITNDLLEGYRNELLNGVKTPDQITSALRELYGEVSDGLGKEEEITKEEEVISEENNDFLMLTQELINKLKEIKSLLGVEADRYKFTLDLYEGENQEETNIEKLKSSINLIQQDINNINNGTFEFRVEEDEIDDEVEKQDESEPEDEVEEDEIDDEVEKIDSQVNKEHKVKRGENLWKIISDHYNLSRNQDIVNKIQEVIELQNEGRMKDRLKRSKGDLIWVGDNIKLP